MNRFADLPLETRREAYIRIDRKSGQAFVMRDGERYALEPLDVACIAEEAMRALTALACKRY